MNFKTLSHELKLQETSAENTLHAIKTWCMKHISTDIQYSGNTSEQIEHYTQLARFFLDEFLTKITEPLDIPIKTLNDMNAIQYAASQGWDKYLSTLTKPTAINTPNRFGMTALHLAAVKGHVNTTQVLLDLGADLFQKNAHGSLPILSSLSLPLIHPDTLMNQKEKIFKLLWKKAPESLLERNESGETVLHLMAEQGYATLMSEVLTKYPNLIQVPNNHSHFPIHTAILNQQMGCVSLLLKHQDVSEQQDNQGRTALHYSARYGSDTLVNTCCNAITNIDPLDCNERTPLMLAAESGNIPAISILVARGANLDAQDTSGKSTLHYAVLSGNIEALQWLLNHTDINLCQEDMQGKTPLDYCHDNSHMKSILLQKRTDHLMPKR